MENIFVYGTLMNNQKSHDDYLKNSIFISNGFMYGFLYEINNYPTATHSDYTYNRVMGEIYSINNDLLFILDDYEGGNYSREKVAIHTENDSIDCWVYLLKKI